MKVIEEAMAKRVMERLGGAPQYGHNYGPYGSGDWPYVLPKPSPYVYPGTPYAYGYPGYPYYYPLGGYGVGDGAAALKAYHDLILGYEAQNAIAGLVHPSVDVVKAALDAATAAPGSNSTNTADAPKAASLLEESVVLQVNGAPVTVNPETMLKVDTEARTNLGLVDMVVGLDELSVAQKKQLKGPEEGMELETMQKRLAQINNKIAKDHTFLQTLPDEPHASQAGVGEDLGEVVTAGGNEIHFAKKHHRHSHHAQKRTLPDEPHASQAGVGEDLGEVVTAGGNEIHFAKRPQQHVQRRTLPDTPRDGVNAVNGGDAVQGMAYNEDLGEDSRVGADNVHYAKRHHHAQTGARTLPDEPWTLPGGNVAVNGGHDVEGMVGDEDLGEDIRVGPDNIHFIKQKHHRQHRAQHRTLPDTPRNGNKATFQGDDVEGMVGNEDLGEDARVGADNVHYRKTHRKHRY